MSLPAARLVTGAPLAHLRWGEAGPLALLLHGIGGGRQAWGHGGAGTGATLAAAGFQVVAIDFPGYGLSPAPAEWSIAALADPVGRLIGHLDAGPAVVIGHSLGGMVAQELVARSPTMVRALVLAGTSPAFGRADGAWQQDFLRSRFAPLDAGQGMAGLAAQLVPAMVGPAATPERIAAAQALMAGVPEATYRAVLQALVHFDRREALPRIGVPTLVITGEHDRTAPPPVARRMAEHIPGARVEILAGAGHLLNLEQPDAFDAAVLHFLRGALQ